MKRFSKRFIVTIEYVSQKNKPLQVQKRHSLTRILEREYIKMLKRDMQGVHSGNVSCLQVNVIP